jgi:glycosyltransferase involved in cell wall biosynthesis
VGSVLQQTLAPGEIILVDDCSDDAGATLAALYALQRANPGFAVSIIALKQNVGPGAARNAGWEVAGGNYLAFLDADDSWHPQKLEVQLAWMQGHPEAVLSGGRSELYDVDAVPPALNLPPTVTPVGRLKLLLVNCFPTRTVMLRRDTRQRFDPHKRYAEDYLLWLRIVLSGLPAYRIELPLAYSYKAEFGAAGLSASLWKMQKGLIDTYQRIGNDCYISKILAYFFILLSLIKFARRLVLSALAGRKHR